MTSLPHHRIASMANPRPNVSRRDKITQCRDEGITLEMVVKGDRWKALCYCYKDPTIDGSNGYSKCERSYGLEQQHPGRQNGAWNGGSMCRRLLKSSNKCDMLHVRKSGAAANNLHHRAARQSKRRNEISGKVWMVWIERTVSGMLQVFSIPSFPLFFIGSIWRNCLVKLGSVFRDDSLLAFWQKP